MLLLSNGSKPAAGNGLRLITHNVMWLAVIGVILLQTFVRGIDENIDNSHLILTSDSDSHSVHNDNKNISDSSTSNNSIGHSDDNVITATVWPTQSDIADGGNGINQTNLISGSHRDSTVKMVLNGSDDGSVVEGHPVVKLPSNTLLKYTAYKDVAILHFRIPSDTRTAFFVFKAMEETKSAFQRACQPNDITLHLKAGSYPVISPENITFPKHFLDADQRFEIHTLQFQSDSTTVRLSIDGPHPGNWFGIAFISWTDPNNERIEQQGLAASCETTLSSEMSIISIIPEFINPDAIHPTSIWSNQTTPTTYKFYVPNTVAIVTWKITIQAPCATDCSNLSVHVQAQALPTAKNYLLNTQLVTNVAGEQSFDFYPHENCWHFVDVVMEDAKNETNGEELRFNIEMVFRELSEPITRKATPTQRVLPQRNLIDYPVLRQTYREFFMFDYDLLPDVNGTVPMSLNLTGGSPAVMKFEVGDVYDIGGTLSFAVAMKHDMKGNLIDSPPKSIAIAEKLVDTHLPITNGHDEDDDEVFVPRSNQTVIVCLNLGEPGIPTWPDKCVFGNEVHPATICINNTDSDTSTGLVHVPFPESGQWFVTMGLFCHGAETAARNTIIDSVKDFIRKHIQVLKNIQAPCSCAERIEFYRSCIAEDRCLVNLNETETLKIKECIMDSKCTKNSDEMAREFEVHHKFATEQSVATGTPCNASTVFTISSSPCVAGRCGRYGRCYHYMSGGFVFSTCLCIKNYRGWDCTEDSEVPSSISILIASLMLTLSNLLFFPSIYFAVRREYYTESVIYFFTMFFSVFYHACDSGDEEYNFCLVKIGVLQFCDFYCGLLAIWVTLIAMANLRQTLVSLLHMFGAILLAFGTELNKQSLWVFLAPALTGICLISVSWGLRCRKTKKWFPSRNYLAIYLPIGSVMVMVGLVCYAFLQTKQNYYIVHSIWHMVMALSILCLLPNPKTFQQTKC